MGRSINERRKEILTLVNKYGTVDFGHSKAGHQGRCPLCESED